MIQLKPEQHWRHRGTTWCWGAWLGAFLGCCCLTGRGSSLVNTYPGKLSLSACMSVCLRKLDQLPSAQALFFMNHFSCVSTVMARLSTEIAILCPKIGTRREGLPWVSARQPIILISFKTRGHFNLSCLGEKSRLKCPKCMHNIHTRAQAGPTLSTQ